MVKFYKLIFFMTMMTSSLIVISSYSWMSMWIGLEINLLSIIPLMKDNLNQFPSESGFKYFITQAMASTIFLFSMIINMNLTEQINNFFNNVFMMTFYSSILIKLGAAPFHAWFPEVLEGLTWMNCLMLMTWQKIAPMVILMQNFKLSMFLILVIITSSMISGIMGFNQISMRKIMAYSSINHVAWMITSMLSTKMIWLIYFLIYSLISIVITSTMNTYKILYFHQINNLTIQKNLNLLINLNFLSLGGLPPFLGFLPKWLTINFLINGNNYTLTTLLVMHTLISLFIYTRILFSGMALISSETLKINLKLKPNFFLISSNLLILVSMISCPLFLNYL